MGGGGHKIIYFLGPPSFTTTTFKKKGKKREVPEIFLMLNHVEVNKGIRYEQMYYMLIIIYYMSGLHLPCVTH